MTYQSNSLILQDAIHNTVTKHNNQMHDTQYKFNAHNNDDTITLGSTHRVVRSIYHVTQNIAGCHCCWQVSSQYGQAKVFHVLFITRGPQLAIVKCFNESFVVACIWNVMAHAKKPDFVFWRNRWVHLNWRGRGFSRLLAAEVCASAVVMLDTPCSEVVWRVLATHSIRQFPLHRPPPVHHRVPSHFN